jgi:phosphatidylinositol alpha-1,6-mannosyltransferase
MDVEGLGVVFLEASALGLPVVVGDSGGAPDAVRDGETGYLVDGRDIDQVAERIAELLDDGRLRAKFGEAGRRWVAGEWQWDIVAARLRDMLDAS